MKIAFTTSGDSLNSPLDTRFGRAPKFILYDTETKEFEVLDNTRNLNAAQGAGVQSAQNVVRSGAQCVVTGHCGPKAFSVLTAGGVAIYYSEEVTVEKALEMFLSGALPLASDADVDSHWV